MTTPALELRGLTKHFPVKGSGPLVAVDDVSLSVVSGSTLAIVGESGSGKSTIGRCVLGLTSPTSGQVLFDGRDVTALGGRERRALRRQIQMVFQDPYESLNPRLRIGTLLEEPLRLLRGDGPAERTRRIAELLELVRLDAGVLRRFPHQLSGGQLQRIGIARAISVEPEVIVLDEPTSSLDLSTRAGILTLLHRLQDELGLTYVFISHDLHAVRRIASEVAVMYRGRVVEQGEVADVVECPQHPYTQSLVSAALVPDPRAQLRRLPLRQEPPGTRRPEEGCLFQHRCPLVRDDCRPERPALLPTVVRPATVAACVRCVDGTNQLQAVGEPA